MEIRRARDGVPIKVLPGEAGAQTEGSTRREQTPPPVHG